MKTTASSKTRSAKAAKQLRFKSLLVPIDFSETSLAALNYAVTLAEEFGAQIRLFHVLESPGIFSKGDAATAHYAEIMRKRLAQLAGDRIGGRVPVAVQVRIGRAHKLICDTAQKLRCDLVVIGTHGFTGLKHLLLGSTAERVIRHAPCSVLVVRKATSRKPTFALKLKKILAPTDFSEPAERALAGAVALARQYQSTLHLLYVVPIHYATGEYDVVDYAVLAAEQRKEGKTRLAALSRKLQAKKIRTDARIAHGRPAVEINETAATLDVDLIVISTHGHTGWNRMTLGSTTEEVVRHASCPVLVVKNF
jgi:nucleotide-binding universal stress UspA family protein